MVVVPQQEYPMVCIGVSRGSSPSHPVYVEYINLNSNTSWFTNTGLGKLTARYQKHISVYHEVVLLLLLLLLLMVAVFALTERPCPEVVQVNQLDNNSLLVLLESKYHTKLCCLQKEACVC